MEFSVKGKNYFKTLATNFSPLIHSHCYSQVASIFTLIWDHSVKHFLPKCLLKIDTRNLHARIVVPKLQSLIFRVTRRVVLLVYCIVPNVPISQQNQSDLNYNIAKKHNAQNLSLLSSVNFVIKSFQDFTLYVNIKTPSIAFLSRQKLIRTVSSMKLMMPILRRNCAHVNISL